MVFLDRGRKAGKYLEWKVRLFGVGAVLALAGLYLDERWMTGLAILVLLAGMLVRFLPGARTHPEAEDEEANGAA